MECAKAVMADLAELATSDLESVQSEADRMVTSARSS
jgi:hypothetical protein